MECQRCGALLNEPETYDDKPFGPLSWRECSNADCRLLHQINGQSWGGTLWPTIRGKNQKYAKPTKHQMKRHDIYDRRD